MKKIKEEKRKNYIDFFKGIGIILMIAGHIGFGNIFDQIIHAFNMPMFFVASGYCYKTPQKFNQFLTKKIRSLIIPYFFFATITFIILRKPNGISLEEFKHIFWINNINTPIAGIWFMTALLWAIIAYYFIQKIKCYDLQWLVVMLITMSGMTIRNVWGGRSSLVNGIRIGGSIFYTYRKLPSTG